jgi:hypothetical protein
MSPTIVSKIRDPYSRIFRRVSIKRKDGTTGLFESSWQDISSDVEAWGHVRREIDSVRYSKIRFGDVLMRFDNSSGRYNPNEDETSFWYGYGSQQRTLVKIEAGFLHQTLGANNIWTNIEYPSVPSVFYGIISGDIFVSDQARVQMPVRPLLQVFRDFPARNLTGWTSTGMTASQFFTMIRDQTDGSSNFIFRPFFGDTTTNWSIVSTSNVYSNLNTSGADGVFDATVWDVMEKLAEAEDLVMYVKNNGQFVLSDRSADTSTSQYNFFGAGFTDGDYGHTIKRISRYGKKQTDYYSRVEVKFRDADTVTSYRVQETSFTVTGSNDPWNLGHRTFKFENFWIPGTTTADAVLATIFTNVTNIKEQIDFTTSFVPHLELLNRIQISYDSSAIGVGSRWDFYDWAADDTTTANDLIWDKLKGDAIRLSAQEFKILSIDLDLDKMETKITAIRA